MSVNTVIVNEIIQKLTEKKLMTEELSALFDISVEVKKDEKVLRKDKRQSVEVTDFFTNLSGFLSIETSRDGRRIVACEIEEVRCTEDEDDDEDYDYEKNKFLTPAQWSQCAYPMGSITFLQNPIDIQTVRSRPCRRKYTSPSGEFTVRELAQTIAKWEKHLRVQPGFDWFGEIDTHHIYYEGIERRSDGTYEVHWGS
jgi:hypothetical protein